MLNKLKSNCGKIPKVYFQMKKKKYSKLNKKHFYFTKKYLLPSQTTT